MATMWRLLSQNYQWFFSGIGVLLITWVGRSLWNRSKRNSSRQPPQNSTISKSPIAIGETVNQSVYYNYSSGHPGNDSGNREKHPTYQRDPSPLEIFQRIRTLPLYEQHSSIHSYKDIAVEWTAHLSFVDPDKLNTYSIHLIYKPDQFTKAASAHILCKTVDLKRYPKLKLAVAGTEIIVRGIIDELDIPTQYIDLRDVDFLFPERPQLKPPSTQQALHEIRFDHFDASGIPTGWIKRFPENETPRFTTAGDIPNSLWMHAGGIVFALDYEVPTAYDQATKISFDGRFGDNATLYCEVLVTNKISGPGVENWWFAHVIGDDNRTPEKYPSGREYKFFVSPIRKGIAPSFDLDIRQEVKRVFHEEKALASLRTIRIRGDIVLSPIKLAK